MISAKNQAAGLRRTLCTNISSVVPFVVRTWKPYQSNLASVQSSDGRCTADITRRIGLAASAMRSLQTLCRQQHVKLETKLMAFYRTCVLSVLSYEAKTSTIQACDIKTLETFHMRCQRQMLRIRCFNRVSNVKITALPHTSLMFKIK